MSTTAVQGHAVEAPSRKAGALDNVSISQQIQPKTVEDFERQLTRALRRISDDKTISEEELFAAVAEVQVKNTLGEVGSAYFNSIRGGYEQSQGGRYRYPSPEASVKSTIKDLAQIGQFSISDSRAFQQMAARVAQLDSQRGLYDQYGGKGDDTVATTSFQKAVKLTSQRLADLNSGSSSLTQSIQRTVKSPAT